MKNFWRRHWGLGLLVLVWLLLVVTNYKPGTWLTGWDTLHSEFDVGLSFRRMFSGAWTENWGLGMGSGMALMADLPRVGLFAALKLFLSTAFVRYVWVFLLLLMGSWGMYALLHVVLPRKTGNLAGIVGAIFYMCNLATVQYFYTPFVPFITFYGFLPWLLFWFFRYQTSRSWVNLSGLGLCAFLMTPAFVVQTMFIVTAVVLMIASIGLAVRDIRKQWRPLFLAWGVFIGVNLYWLLPVGYFAITHADVVVGSKMNVLSTEETQLLNQGQANLWDIALLKGFWFSYLDTDADGAFELMMQQWSNHIQGGIVILGWALSMMVIAGLVVGMGRNKHRAEAVIPVGLLLVTYFMLAHGGIFNDAFDWVGREVPLFGQIFRSTFTKWSMVMGFVYAWGLASAVERLHVLQKTAGRVIGAVVLTATFILIWPAFRGGLIYDRLQVKIPKDYADLFTFFKGQPKQTRIAVLPAHTLWGWSFTDWGYRGSGFLWYGIEQPILDRAFDVWSAENETFYAELSTALYRVDADGLRRVLGKYDVGYVLLDESVVVPGGDERVLWRQQTKELMAQVGAHIVWQRDLLTVYDLRSVVGVDQWISAPNPYTVVVAETMYGREDSAYEFLGDYVRKSDNKGVVFPWATAAREELAGISYEAAGEGMTTVRLTSESVAMGDYTLSIPGLRMNSLYMTSVEVSYNQDGVLLDFGEDMEVLVNGAATSITHQLPSVLLSLKNSTSEIVVVTVGGETVTVRVGERQKLEQVRLMVGQPFTAFVYDAGTSDMIETQAQLVTQEVQKCWERVVGEGVAEKTVMGEIVRLGVHNASACTTVFLGELEQGLVEIQLPYRSIDGLRPHFCLVAESDPNSCLHDDVYTTSFASGAWSTITRKVPLERKERYWLDIVARASEVRPEMSFIEYGTPEVRIYPQVEAFGIENGIWNEVLRQTDYPLEVEKPAQLEFRYVAPATSVGLLRKGAAGVLNCDLLSRGKVEKYITDGTVRYVALDRGIGCEFADLPQLSAYISYVMRVVGGNVAGRSLKLFIHNSWSGRNDVEVLLPRDKFDMSYGVLPTAFGGGYSLGLETRSIGGERAENTIEEVYFYPLPLDWLSSWRLEPVEDLPAPSTLKNSLEIVSVEKRGTGFYRTTVNGNGLLALSQGYDEGWMAFEVNKKPFDFAQGLWLFKSHRHVKVNGWENGWMVEDSQKARTILVFYWPQMLVWFGFGVIGFGLLFLGFQLLREQRKN